MAGTAGSADTQADVLRWANATTYTYVTRDPFRWEWSLKHHGDYLATGWALTEDRAERAAERHRARALRRLTGQPPLWRARLTRLLHPRRARSDDILTATLT